MDVAQFFFGLMELRAFSGSKGPSILFLPSITRHCSIVPVRELALKSVLPEATNKGREGGGAPAARRSVGLAVSHLAAAERTEIRLSSFFSADRSQMRSMG